MASCFGACVVGSKDATSIAGGEPAYGGASSTIKDCRVVLSVSRFCIIGCVAVSGIGEGGLGDVLYQGVILFLMPQIKLHGNALLYLFGLDASVFAM